jgi:signal transduction histidine kinase
MRERVEMIGGEYNISSIPGKGTTTEVLIPLQKNLSHN